MPSAADIDGIDSQSYNLFLDGEDLGLFVTDSVSASLNDERIDINDVDQFVGFVESIVQGQTGSISATVIAGPKILGNKLIKDRIKTVIASGGKKSFRSGTAKKRVFKLGSGVLLFQPADKDLSDQDDTIAFYRAAVFLEDFQILSSRTQKQVAQITINFGPDLNRLPDENTWAIGNPFIEMGTPSGVWIAAGDAALVPGIHLDGFDMSVDEKQQIQAYAAFSDDSTTITAAIDEGAGITAAQKTFNFDTLSVGSSLVVGAYIKIGTEIMRVEDIDYSVGVDTTDGLLTVQRGVWGTVAATALDNAVITAQENVACIRVTNSADWLSDTPLVVSVGDVFQGSDFSGVNKGLLTGLAVGGPVVVTATFNAVASPSFTSNVA